MRHFFLIMLIAIAISGCSTQSPLRSISQKDSERSYSSTSLISAKQAQAIAEKYFSPQKHSPSSADNEGTNNSFEAWINPRFEKAFMGSSDQERVQLRNDMIDELFILSDYAFNEYKSSLFMNQKALDLGTEYYSLLFSGAATLTTGGITPNILSGIATFFTGVRASINKTVFSEKTIESLVNIMDGNRLNRKADIIKRKKESITNYTLRNAIRETLEMHQEGNLISALTYLQRTTSQYQQNASDAVKKAK